MSPPVQRSAEFPFLGRGSGPILYPIDILDRMSGNAWLMLLTVRWQIGRDEKEEKRVKWFSITSFLCLTTLSSDSSVELLAEIALSLRIT
jgi:hypothetical protein